MSQFKKYFSIAVVVVLVVYLTFALYLKIVSRELVKEAIATIKVSNPEVNQIGYGSIAFSPFDFFKENLSVQNVRMTFNNSNVVLTIGTIDCSHFMGLNQNPFGSFTLSIEDAEVSSFSDLYATLTTWTNNSLLYGELANIPEVLNLNLNATAQYNGPAESLLLNVNLDSQTIPLLTYQVTLTHLVLNQAFFNDPVTFSNAMNAASVSQMNYSANVNASLPVNALSALFPIAANLLHNLGYTTLPLQFQVASDYTAGQNQQAVNAQLVVNNLGSLTFVGNLILGASPSPGKFANFILNPDSTAPASTPTLIQSASLSYTDASFVGRVLQFLGTTTGEPVGTILSTIQTNLDRFAMNLNIPQVSAIANTVSAFLANPGTLTVTLNPTKPFSLDDVTHFFATQKAMNHAIQTNLGRLSGTQKELFFDRYQQASTAGYGNFLNRVGLSVSINQAGS